MMKLYSVMKQNRQVQQTDRRTGKFNHSEQRPRHSSILMVAQCLLYYCCSAEMGEKVYQKSQKFDLAFLPIWRYLNTKCIIL